MRLPRVSGRRAGLWMVLAGAAGVLAVMLTLRAASQPAQAGWVLVAREPIPAGTRIDTAVAMTATDVVPLPEGLRLAGLLSGADAALGRRTVAHLAAGEPITEAVLGGAPGAGPAPLAAGQRAIAVPLSAAAGVAAALAPGVRVDAVASTGEGLTGRTRVVVADAEVIAVGEPGETGEGAEALLRVTARQALLLTAALNFARELRLLVRPHDEDPDLILPGEVSAP